MSLDAVATQSPALAAAEQKRKIDRDFYEGQEAVWKARAEYLPVHPGESTSDVAGYEARLKRSRIVPYMRRAVAFAEGQVFQKPIEFGEDVPVAIRGQVENQDKGEREILGWSENIDLEGRNAWRFFRDGFRDHLVSNFAVLLADTPPGNGELSAASDKRRPYLKRYAPGSLIDVVHQVTPEGRKRVEHVRLLEVTQERDPANPFQKVCVERVRVYDSPEPGNVILTVYRKGAGKSGGWAIETPAAELQAPKLVDIPVVITGDPLEMGVFHDLAHLNAALYRKESDRSQTEFFCVPQPYIKGVGSQAEELKTGIVRAVDNTLLLTSENAEPGFWQAEPAALEQMRESILELKREIEDESLRAMLDSAPGDMTATQVAVNTGQNVSRLQAEWLEFADGVEQCLIYLAQLGGLGEDGGSVSKERAWQDLRPDQVQAQWVQMLLQGNIISKEGAFEIAKAQRAVPDHMEFPTEQERIAKQGPEMGGVGEGPRVLKRAKQLMAQGVPAEEAMARAEAELGDEMPIGEGEAEDKEAA